MDDLEDLICDALQDSMDIDWTCRVGAKAVAKVVAAELSRLSALVAWQDIETAPKDGDELLFCLPRQQGVRLLARWDRIYRVWRKKGEAIYFHPGDLWVRLPAPPVSQLKDTTNADK